MPASTTQSQAAATGSLDAADGLDPSGETKAGLDIGGMVMFGPARIGVMVRNVKQPDVRQRRRRLHA